MFWARLFKLKHIQFLGGPTPSPPLRVVYFYLSVICVLNIIIGHFCIVFFCIFAESWVFSNYWIATPDILAHTCQHASSTLNLPAVYGTHTHTHTQKKEMMVNQPSTFIPVK